MRDEIYTRLTAIFVDIFDDEDIALTDETTAADVEGWDSLAQITLISSVEDEFDISFQMKDVVNLKNVGALVDKIEELLSK